MGLKICLSEPFFFDNPVPWPTTDMKKDFFILNKFLSGPDRLVSGPDHIISGLDIMWSRPDIMWSGPDIMWSGPDKNLFKKSFFMPVVGHGNLGSPEIWNQSD